MALENIGVALRSFRSLIMPKELKRFILKSFIQQRGGLKFRFGAKDLRCGAESRLEVCCAKGG